MAHLSYPTIPQDVIIDIQVSGAFYRQIVNSLVAIGDSRSPKELTAALESMKEDRSSKDYYEAVIRTLTSLVFEIEGKAKAQDKLKTITIDEETGKPIES